MKILNKKCKQTQLWNITVVNKNKPVSCWQTIPYLKSFRQCHTDVPIDEIIYISEFFYQHFGQSKGRNLVMNADMKSILEKSILILLINIFIFLYFKPLSY